LWGKGAASTTRDNSTTHPTSRIPRSLWDDDDDVSACSNGNKNFTSNNTSSNCQRYIWVESLRGAAQGVGNSLHGLLAAHLLGDEFDRTVCVSPSLAIWHAAFVPRNTAHAQACRQLAARVASPHDDTRRRSRTNNNVPTLQLINFLPTPPNECRLQEALRSNTTLVKLQANSYPGWRTVPADYLLRFYQPRVALLELLRSQQQQQPQEHDPPTTVVHLRAPDHAKKDARAGLDPHTLQALVDTLPSQGETYLVTNQVSYYSFFRHWSHPHWESVGHSGGLRGVEWTAYSAASHASSPNVSTHRASANTISNSTNKNNNNSSSLGDLQTMADWYTIYRADTVYHTPSDFSSSARHWRGESLSATTWELKGTVPTTGQLDVQPDAWARDPPLAPLVERSREGVGPYALRNCGHSSFSGGGLGRVVSAVRVVVPPAN
jgi:hypothetical protein